MINPRQQMNLSDYQNAFQSRNGERVIIGDYSFSVHVAKDEIASELWFSAFPDGFDKKLARLSIAEQVKNYRYIAREICITFFKQDGKVICDKTEEELQQLWQKCKEISGESFDAYRMQNVLVDKNGVVFGFSGKSEFSVGYEVLLVNRCVSNAWETCDNNGAGYKTATHYLDLALIRDPNTYEL